MHRLVVKGKPTKLEMFLLLMPWGVQWYTTRLAETRESKAHTHQNKSGVEAFYKLDMLIFHQISMIMK